MIGTDIIKEYLVAIGFDVDNKGFANANKQLQMFEKALGKFATTFAGKFAVAGVAVTSFSLVATGAIGKFLAETAKADMQVEMFARRMFTTEKNARSLKAVMDAMGISDLEQLKDISLNPELRAQFLSLRNATAGLEPGADIQKALQDVRMVGYEFQRLQVLSKYFFMYVAGATAKYLAGPMGDFRKVMADFNDKFAKNMAKWADRIGKGLAMVVRFTGALVKLVGLLNKIPDNIKAITLAVGALGAVIMAGPWGLLIGAISAIGLLADDYFTYKAGGQSALPGLWSGAENIFSGILEILGNIDSTLSALASHFGVKGQKAYNAAKNGGLGAIIGGAGGAILGSVVPGVGTAVGAAVGAGLGAGAGGVIGWNQKINGLNDKEGRILKYLTGQGLSTEGALAILANAKAESGLRTNAVGDHGTSVGLFQWHNSRWSAGSRFLGKDLKNASIEEQLSFLMHELNSMPSLLGKLKGHQSASSLAGEFVRQFERPADPSGQARIRGDLAQKYQNQINIHVHGADNPHATAEIVLNKIRTSLNTTSVQGIHA